MLFLTEAALSRRWPGYFPIYLVVQIILGALLLYFPGYPDSYAILFLLLSMQVVQRRSVRAALLWMGLFYE